MFDPIYERYIINKSTKNINNAKVSVRNFTKEDVIRYNPLESLSRDSTVASSFYEILSIIQTYKLVSCSRLADNSECVCLDLDTTDGFMKAIQGRFANSFTYCLHTKNLTSINSGIDLSRVHNIASSTHSMTSICRTRNMSGIDIAFAVQTSSKEYSINTVVACVAVVSRFGTLVYRVDDYKSILCEDIFSFIYSWFDKIELYKPAMMSCINKGAYIIARQKKTLPLEEYNVEANSVLNNMIKIMEEERKISKLSIGEGIDNTKNFNLKELEYYYLGW